MRLSTKNTQKITKRLLKCLRTFRWYMNDISLIILVIRNLKKRTTIAVREHSSPFAKNLKLTNYCQLQAHSKCNDTVRKLINFSIRKCEKMVSLWNLKKMKRHALHFHSEIIKHKNSIFQLSEMTLLAMRNQRLLFSCISDEPPINW